MKAAQVENMLDLIDSILLDSTVLLRSANKLSYSLTGRQTPAEKLRIEINGIRLVTDGESNRQESDALLEPCRTVTPYRSQNTTQGDGSSDIVTVGPSPSPLLSRQEFVPRQSRSRAPTTFVPGLISPAKRGTPTVCSYLSSPAKIPTPSFFSDALHTPSIASPLW